MNRALALVLITLMLAACKRTKAPETYHVTSLSETRDTTMRLRPGPEKQQVDPEVTKSLLINNPFEGDRKAIQEGRRMYNWMNCKGCHGEGGGGIGPTLWDDQWKYGGRGKDIAESILFGRPDGMPAFVSQLPEDQVWRIVAYVQSMKPRGGPYDQGIK